jgi:hypothetical protein
MEDEETGEPDNKTDNPIVRFLSEARKNPIDVNLYVHSPAQVRIM